jgi:hypothetical protein
MRLYDGDVDAVVRQQFERFARDVEHDRRLRQERQHP